MTHVVERRTSLPLGAATVWSRATSMEGIRHELWPVASMTTPPGLRGRSIEDLGDLLGQRLGKAWVLLCGVLPVEYDDMTVAALEPGRRFHEKSRMLLLPRWEHERTIEPEDEGCVVHDRLIFEPRLGLLAPVARRIVGALFSHRHRRLSAWCDAQGQPRSGSASPR